MYAVEAGIFIHHGTEEKMTHADEFFSPYSCRQKRRPLIGLEIDEKVIAVSVQFPANAPKGADRVVPSFFIYFYEFVYIRIITYNIGNFFIDGQRYFRIVRMTAQNL